MFLSLESFFYFEFLGREDNLLFKLVRRKVGEYCFEGWEIFIGLVVFNLEFLLGFFGFSVFLFKGLRMALVYVLRLFFRILLVEEKARYMLALF